MIEEKFMSHIDNIIARIPSMDKRSRSSLRENIGKTLEENADDSDAHRVLAALNALEATLDTSPPLQVTGLLAWEKRPHEKQFTFRAFRGDRVVGAIFKSANHSSSDKNVYSVEIHGQQLPGQFHHIKDARVAGEAAFVEQCDGDDS